MEIEENLNKIKNLIIEMDKKVPKDTLEKKKDDLSNKKTTIENEIKKDEEEIKKCIDAINNDEEIKNIEKQISELEKSINDKKNSIEYYEELKGKLKDINNFFKIMVMLNGVNDIVEEVIKNKTNIEKDKIENEAKRLKLDLNKNDILTIQNIFKEEYRGITLDVENKKMNSEISRINNLIKSFSKNLISCELIRESSIVTLGGLRGEIIHILGIKTKEDTKYFNLIKLLKENKLDGVLAKASNNNKKEQLILNENSINIIDKKIGEIDNIIKELNNSYNDILNIKDTNGEILNKIKNNKINSDEKIKNLNKSIEDKKNELKVIDSKIDEFEKILDYSDNKIVFSSAFNRTLFSSAFNKIIKKADNSNIIKSNIKSNNVERLKEIIEKLEEFKNKDFNPNKEDFDPNEIKKELDYLLLEQGEFLIKVVGNLPNKEYINEEEILKSNIKEKESPYENIKEKGPIENTQRKIYDGTSFEK